MPKYVYRTIDIQSNQVLEDVDLQDVSFTIKLNGVGSLDATLFVPESKRGLLLNGATQPGRTGLYVLRDEVPVWGGFIWKRSWDEASASFKLSCGSWESYAYHVLQLNDRSYTSTDQLQIARELIAINWIWQESGIEFPGAVSSGVMRQRTMKSWEFKTVGLELEQLAGLENGFDYAVQNYIRFDGSFGRRYIFGYPRLGRTASLTPNANNLTFDYPGNLAPFSMEEDAENAAVSTWAVGSGEGSSMLISQYGDGTYQYGITPRIAQAAKIIYDHMNAGLPVNTDWTWAGQPAIVTEQIGWLRLLASGDKVFIDTDGGYTQVKPWLLAYYNANGPSVMWVPTVGEPYSAWPRLDAVSTYKDVSIQATLDAHVNEDGRNNLPPLESWTFQLAHNADISLNDLSVGDSAVFRLSSRRWELPIEMIRRIVEIKVTPPGQGTLEKIELGLEDERDT